MRRFTTPLALVGLVWAVQCGIPTHPCPFLLVHVALISPFPLRAAFDTVAMFYKSSHVALVHGMTGGCIFFLFQLDNSRW